MARPGKGLSINGYSVTSISSRVRPIAPSRSSISDSKIRPMLPMRKQSALVTLPK